LYIIIATMMTSLILQTDRYHQFSVPSETPVLSHPPPIRPVPHGLHGLTKIAPEWPPGATQTLQSALADLNPVIRRAGGPVTAPSQHPAAPNQPPFPPLGSRFLGRFRNAVTASQTPPCALTPPSSPTTLPTSCLGPAEPLSAASERPLAATSGRQPLPTAGSDARRAAVEVVVNGRTLRASCATRIDSCGCSASYGIDCRRLRRRSTAV